MVFLQQLRFAHRQSGIETEEVRVRGQDDWAYIEHYLSYVSIVTNGSVSHASRTNNLIKFEYGVTVTRVRPLDATTLK